MTRSAHPAIDLRPLRHGRYRLLFTAQVISALGAIVLVVALPYQTYVLTRSSLAVGFLGLAEFVPILGLSLVGGVLADAHDRRRLVQAGDLAFGLATLALAANALLPSPRLWPLYLVAAATAGLDALQRPALDALIPRLVPREQLHAAAALSTLRYTALGVLGPALAGAVIGAFGFQAAYVLGGGAFLASCALLFGLRVDLPSDALPPSAARVVEGLRYAFGRRDLLAIYLVDFVAMFFGMPNALFPALASRFGGAMVVGSFYAAPAVGAMLAALVSGWTGRIRRHGRAIVVAALVWGVAIAFVGIAPVLVIALVSLGVAGFADAISGMFRQTLCNQTVPDALRGRLGGIEYLSYASGPTLGNVEAGAVAAAFGARISVVSGGVLCVLGVAITAFALPALWRYNAEDANAVSADAASTK